MNTNNNLLVRFMEGKDQYSEDYWKGVADALTLVENFLYWRSAHPDRSRDPLEFVHNCLKEVRKKIGPSLVEILGVSFEKEESETEENIPSVTTQPMPESVTAKTEAPTTPEAPTSTREEELTVVPVDEEEEEENLFSEIETTSTEKKEENKKGSGDNTVSTDEDENPFI